MLSSVEAWWSLPTGAPDLVTAALLLLALYLALGRFFAGAHFRRTSYYAITNTRILIIGGFRGKSLEAHDFPDVKDVVLRLRKDGLGTIEFGPRWPFLKWHSTYFQNLELYRTADAEAAADLIRNRGRPPHPARASP
jgi:hypothetical protein